MRTGNSDWQDRRVDLLRYVARRVADTALREDIVQEAMVRYFAYQAKPGIIVTNITGLLNRISLDLTRDHFRRLGRTPVVELPDDLACTQPGIQEQLEQRQVVGMIVDILQAMPRLRREVFFRRRFEGQSSKEVAEDLKLSPGAVDAHIARAVLDLHLAIEKLEKRGALVRG